MPPQVRTLLAALRQPAETRILSGQAWSQLIATARTTNLLGTLAERLHDAGVSPLPQIERHLSGARSLARRQRLSVQWEAHQLQQALGHLGVPVVLLKGAAYVMNARPMGIGRMFGDIDVLVPRKALDDVESQLMLHGWVSAKSSEYDQRYYRKWMHEIPPMTNLRRGTVIDVHHTILPLTASSAPDPERIIARSHPIDALPALRIPSIEDLLIHSATHLVHEGELQNGLRDLVDIDDMVLAQASRLDFWKSIVASAQGSDLAGPVGFGLRLARAVLGTPVPDNVIASLDAKAHARWRRPWLTYLYSMAIVPPGAAPRSTAAGLSRALVYLRAHRLRMPMSMLARHLSTKAWMSLRQQPNAADS